MVTKSLEEYLKTMYILKKQNGNIRVTDIANNEEEIENSLISDVVFETIQKNQCVNTVDRITPLDYWVSILAFTFDLNFNVTLKKLSGKSNASYTTNNTGIAQIVQT